MNKSDRAKTATQLRQILDEVDDGIIDATASEHARLAGAVVAMDSLVSEDA